MTRILLVADTHAPGQPIPQQVWDEIGMAGIVVHAGDWTSWDTYLEFDARCVKSGAELIGVAGNCDDDRLRALLPQVRLFGVQGLWFGVIHDLGPQDAWRAWIEERMNRPDVVVSGHTHVPLDASFQGTRLLNPGSATLRYRQPWCTVLRLEVTGGQVASTELVTLPRTAPAGRR